MSCRLLSFGFISILLMLIGLASTIAGTYLLNECIQHHLCTLEPRYSGVLIILGLALMPIGLVGGCAMVWCHTARVIMVEAESISQETSSEES